MSVQISVQRMTTLSLAHSPLAQSSALADEECGPSEAVNFVAYSNEDPVALAGPPDGAGFGGETARAGFVAFTFPDSQSAPEVSPSTGQAMVRVHVVE